MHLLAGGIAVSVGLSEAYRTGPSMTLSTYTPKQLLAKVRTLEEFLPISGKIGLSHHHDSHRDHWIKWLREYDGPGSRSFSLGYASEKKAGNL